MKENDKKNKKTPLVLGANWTNLSGRIRKEYPHITNSDIQFMARGENELISRLHLKSGKTKSQIRDWVRSMAKIM